MTACADFPTGVAMWRHACCDVIIEFGIEPVCNQLRAISTCGDSLNLLKAGRKPVRSQIPLRYLVADRFEAGRGPAADLLARASSLLAS